LKIERLEQSRLNTTMMGVVKAVLDYYRIEMSAAWAFGGSGHAFLISIHDEICPSGPYCWKYEPFYKLVRNLGIDMIDLGFFEGSSSREARAEVEEKLKAHLDQGQPCALGNLENQVIFGYDDRQFFTAQPWGDCCDGFPPATLTFGTWQEFKDECHATFWTFKKFEPRDDSTAVRDSLAYAVDQFKHPEQHSFERYGVGLKAYDNWARAVGAGHGGSHGNWWNATVWSECRAMAADYFTEIGQRLVRVAGPAFELSKAYKEIAGLLAKVSDKEMQPGEKARILAELRGKELAAINKVEKLLAAV